MTKDFDRKAHTELLARQFAARLAAEGLGVKAQKDRKTLAREARTEIAERRHLIEMRRRPSYATVEAEQPFKSETRLIRSKDRPDVAGTVMPERRPTFEEMRAKSTAYPEIPAEVREVKRRKREQRRARARESKRSGRTKK